MSYCCLSSKGFCCKAGVLGALLEMGSRIFSRERIHFVDIFVHTYFVVKTYECWEVLNIDLSK